MHHGAYHIGGVMAERKETDKALVKIGQMLVRKRKALGKNYYSREKFIYNRSFEIFGGKQWISTRHLSNVELGKNWISIEKLIVLAEALEVDPVELFGEIIEIYKEN